MSPHRDELPIIVFVAAIEASHGFGCQSCGQVLPPRFAGVFVETYATPGTCGQLHYVCDLACGNRLLAEFPQAELWDSRRVRAFLDREELLAGVVGVRTIETPLGPGWEFCECVLPSARVNEEGDRRNG